MIFWPKFLFCFLLLEGIALFICVGNGLHMEVDIWVLVCFTDFLLDAATALTCGYRHMLAMLQLGHPTILNLACSSSATHICRMSSIEEAFILDHPFLFVYSNGICVLKSKSIKTHMKEQYLVLENSV